MYQIAQWIRDFVTSHYIPQEIRSAISSFPNDHRFEIYEHMMDGNSFSPFAEEVAFIGIMNLHKMNIDQIIEFESWIDILFKRCITFRHDFFICLCAVEFPNKRLETVRVSVPSEIVAILPDATMPIFSLTKSQVDQG